MVTLAIFFFNNQVLVIRLYHHISKSTYGITTNLNLGVGIVVSKRIFSEN